jgi:outer membrane receptor protein involved in Fe transport
LVGGFRWGAPQSYNPTCGAELDSIGSGNNPDLKPESADDYEVAYGHRFNVRTVVQADFYSSYELNPLVSGVFPISTVPSGDLPSDLSDFVTRLRTKCQTLDSSHFGVSDMFNAGSARYRGFDLGAKVGLVPNVDLNADWAVQSAVYDGMNDNILSQDPYLINGAQLWYVPLHRASVGIGYSNPSGFGTRLDGYYVGTPNGFQRSAYMYANFNISQAFEQHTILSFGVNNLFNSVAQQYGFIGLGQTRPQNQFGDTTATALGEGIEQFGLPYRQVWLTVTEKI